MMSTKRDYNFENYLLCITHKTFSNPFVFSRVYPKPLRASLEDLLLFIRARSPSQSSLDNSYNCYLRSNYFHSAFVIMLFSQFHNRAILLYGSSYSPLITEMSPLNTNYCSLINLQSIVPTLFSQCLSSVDLFILKVDKIEHQRLR